MVTSGILMRRRSFFAVPALGFAAGSPDTRILATGDGIPHTPTQSAALLAKLTESAKADSFSRGGIVEQLEQTMARMLGKEAAVWMPTGTLANHMAVRLLAGEKRRVLVQKESHLFNDCGDCCQTLSNLHLVPLAPGKATFTLDDIESEMSRAASGRVSVPIGAIQIETPVRRRTGEAFDLAEMRRIVKWAREHKIGLHLDGARLPFAAAYTKTSMRDYAAMFDTVYISMYKYFNAPSGAILAGPKALLDDLYHTRRMFGGGLNQVWPFATIALHYIDGFEDRYARAVAASEQVITALEKDGNFEIRRVPNGTNVFHFRMRGVNAPIYQQRVEAAGIVMATPTSGEWFELRVNETWNRATPAEITDRFRRGMG